MNRLIPSVFIAVAATILSLPVTAGTLLVANKSDATLSLIDVEDGSLRSTVPTGPAPHEVAISPDGRTALVANYGASRAGRTLTLVDVRAAEVMKTIDLGRFSRPHGVAFLDDRRALVTAEDDQALLEVDVQAGEIVRSVSTGQRTSHMVAPTPDGRRAFVANIGSGTVTAIDLTAGEKLDDVSTGAGAEGVAVTPDGAQVWVSNRAADTVSVLDAASLDILAELPCDGFPIRAEITPDGRHVLVSAARAGAVCVFDAQDRELVRRVPLDAPVADTAGRLLDFGDSPVPIGIQIAPEGDRAWIALTNADRVVELDLETWEVSRSMATGREPDGMGYSPLEVRAGSEPPAGG